MIASRVRGAFVCLAALLSFAAPAQAAAPAQQQNTQDLILTFLDLSFMKFTPDNTTVYLGKALVFPDVIVDESQFFYDRMERKLIIEYTGRGGTPVTETFKLRKPNGGKTWITLVIDPETGELKRRLIKVDGIPGERFLADKLPNPNPPTGGAGPAPATVASSNGSGRNPEVYTTQDTPVIGERFEAQVDLTSSEGLVSVLKIGLGGDLDTGVQLAGGELLVLPPYLSSEASTSGKHALEIPNHLGLAGVALSTQAVVLGGRAERQLTNRLTLVLGF